MTPVVELRGVGRRYAGTPPVDAVQDVDLTIERGQYVSIVGPSGSGKSTLLHLIGLLVLQPHVDAVAGVVGQELPKHLA